MRILKSMENEIILGGVIDGNTIKVWCPYCHKIHTHGWQGTEKNPTSRIAHCGVGPLVGKEYYIMPVKFN